MINRRNFWAFHTYHRSLTSSLLEVLCGIFWAPVFQARKSHAYPDMRPRTMAIRCLGWQRGTSSHQNCCEGGTIGRAFHLILATVAPCSWATEATDKHLLMRDI